MTEPTTHTLHVPGAVLTYDVHQPTEEPDGHRPLFIFGSPMGAAGFEQLVSHFGDRTVITYDPRGMERSTRAPGEELTAETHAEDYHRVIEAAGLGPVDAFGSSGGGMCALHWVIAHPEDVNTLVSHEPPLVTMLEDRDIAIKVNADIVDTYQRAGFGPAMAKFMQLVMRQSPLPSDYLDQPAPDPARFGLPTEDDGSRDDLLLGGNLAMPPFEPDTEALRVSSVRIDEAARRSPRSSPSHPWSSPAATAASRPASGRPTTTPARSPGSCARCWTERQGGLRGLSWIRPPKSLRRYETPTRRRRNRDRRLLDARPT
jgi:pimeloyl-ACP methyl ester carboxylesterase